MTLFVAMVSLVLPAAMYAVTFLAVRPRSGAIAPLRLATVRAAVLVGGYAIAGIEVLSVFGLVNRLGVCLLWAVGSTGAMVVAFFRIRTPRAMAEVEDEIPRTLSSWDPITWVFGIVLAILGLGTLTVALAAEPNTWDSMSYHLTKVEQWVSQSSVDHFPSSFFSQNALAPGAEYFVLHLRLATGGDSLANLPQWLSGVACALIVSRIAAQLGARRWGQLGAAFAVATTPMVLLQATSTQTDLVVSAWLACLATLVIDVMPLPRHGLGLRDSAVEGRLTNAALVGLAVGLAVITKSTGIVASGVIMISWLVVSATKITSTEDVLGLAKRCVAILAMALVIAGPFLLRMSRTYGNPLGPPVVTYHAMEVHDPPSVIVNGLRHLQNLMITPVESLNTKAANGVKKLARGLGVDVLDSRTTRASEYPVPFYAGTNEDLASYPIQVGASFLALGTCLIFCRRNWAIVVSCLVVVGIWIGYALTIKWQWYANRLLLPGLVLAAPLIGLAIDVFTRQASSRDDVDYDSVDSGKGRVSSVVLGVIVCVVGYAGVKTVLNQTFRPLLNSHGDSVLTSGEWTTRFARAPYYRPDFEWAAETIESAGVQTVGLVASGVPFEYPFWLLLKEQELVHLASDVPGNPSPPPESRDAVLCYAFIESGIPEPECITYVPAGWRLLVHGHVGVALNPRLG